MTRFRSIWRLVPIVSVLGLGACLDSSTLVKVKSDGTGTVEQTLLLNTQAVASMMGGLFGAQPGAGTDTTQTREPVSEDDLRQAGERMGKGVKLVSSEKISRNGWDGVKAIYSFEDINALEPSPAGPGGGPSDGEQMRVKLSKLPNGHSLLTLTIPNDAARRKNVVPPSGPPDQVPPEMMAMVKTLIAGLRMDMAVEVDGRIVQTNASYVEGPRVTLLSVDAAALLADENRLKELQALGPGASFSDLRPLLEKAGVKVNDETIRIEFTGR